MKKRLFLICFACMFCLCAAELLSACSKDGLLDMYNRSLQAGGRNVLTRNLQGERQEGNDSYTGTYTADLKDATVREYLFGGTSIEREDGYHFTVEADFHPTQGSAALVLEEGSEEPQTLFDGTGHFETELDLGPGSAYFVLDAADCTGSVSVSVDSDPGGENETQSN